MSKVAFDIVNKFDSFGLADVLKEFTKEDIEEAIAITKDADIKKKLSIIVKNWDKANALLSAIESLSELVDSQGDQEDDETFDDEEFEPEETIEDPFSSRDWESEDFDNDSDY